MNINYSTEMLWWQGVIEDRQDPLYLGRCKVRIFGWHSPEKSEMPTEELPWGDVSLPPDNGGNPIGLREGDWCWGFFMDGKSGQKPVIVGFIPAIPVMASNPNLGFSDPTPASMLSPKVLPRPPEYGNDPGEEFDLNQEFLSRPCDYTRISSPFGPRKSPTTGASSFHKGVDYAAPKGTPVRAISDGTIISASFIRGGGNTIYIQHANGIVSEYMHLDSFASGIKPGVEVSIGDHIGGVGNTGISTGNHLHFGIREGGKHVDPIAFLAGKRTQEISPDLQETTNDKIVKVDSSGNTIYQNEKGELTKVPTYISSLQQQENADKKEEDQGIKKGPYGNPNILPGNNIAFGVLQKEYDPKKSPFDRNGDGVFDWKDVLIMIKDYLFGGDTKEDHFAGENYQKPQYEMSRYPLNERLDEPISSRLSRNQDIDNTIVGKKNGGLSYGEAATHTATGIGTDVGSEAEGFVEPRSPYNAKYPYNHVYESESGHYIEVDDTPLAERLHWYHRSGTYRENHPDGTCVDKTVGKGYHFVKEDFNFATDKFANYSAREQFRINSGMEMNLKSGGSQNRDVGGDKNTAVDGDSNTKINGDSHSQIKGDVYSNIEGEIESLNEKNIFLQIDKDGNILIKGDLNLKIDGNFHVSVGGETEIKSQGAISLKSDTGVFVDAPLMSVIPLIFGEITHAKFAELAKIIMPLHPPVITIPYLVINKADHVKELKKPEELEQTTSSAKEGFVWSDHFGDLWKPISESDGKPVSLTHNLGKKHYLVEALPTGELENVEISYKHTDGSFTIWEVTRPVHVMGTKIIEEGRFSGNANGGRDHYRWSKYASEYPKQMFLKIGDYGQLLLNPEVRHEALFGADSLYSTRTTIEDSTDILSTISSAVTEIVDSGSEEAPEGLTKNILQLKTPTDIGAGLGGLIEYNLEDPAEYFVDFSAEAYRIINHTKQQTSASLINSDQIPQENVISVNIDETKKRIVLKFNELDKQDMVTVFAKTFKKL